MNGKAKMWQLIGLVAESAARRLCDNRRRAAITLSQGGSEVRLEAGVGRLHRLEPAGGDSTSEVDRTTYKETLEFPG